MKETEKLSGSKSKLPVPLTSYRSDGYNFKLWLRKGKFGLFQQLTDYGKVVGWEVIVIQSNKKKEYAPKSEAWGKLGWSFIKLDDALQALIQLSNHNRPMNLAA